LSILSKDWTCFIKSIINKQNNILKIINISHYKTVARPEDREDLLLPEVCFIGRSNVGKSSLINRLVMQKIARVGSTPGVTHIINQYVIVYEFENTRGKVVFSDFPGFGYAKVSKRTYIDWKNLIDGYFKGNNNIKLVIWTFDIRREMNELDKLFFEWIKEKGYKYVLVLTKLDKLRRNEMVFKKAMFSNIFKECQVFLFSSVDGEGREELLHYIFSVLSAS